MNLANSESHNFSSEVLLRNASNTWDNKIATQKLSKWVESIGVDTKQFNFADGSGLSRDNRTTTKAISHVLAFMDKHRYSNYYISSMSIIGKRGTLRNQYDMNSSGITFHGKSGTLSDVRSLSGYLYTPSRKSIISIIQNNKNLDHNIFSNILSVVSSEYNCS
jgi:D-alanyl-D-alanine carboxypeptidase/D-alanyl-D-alanine-endopeptidase (penicillin-binding protein 4)